MDRSIDENSSIINSFHVRCREIILPCSEIGRTPARMSAYAGDLNPIKDCFIVRGIENISKVSKTRAIVLNSDD